MDLHKAARRSHNPATIAGLGLTALTVFAPLRFPHIPDFWLDAGIVLSCILIAWGAQPAVIGIGNRIRRLKLGSLILVIAGLAFLMVGGVFIWQGRGILRPTETGEPESAGPPVPPKVAVVEDLRAVFKVDPREMGTDKVTIIALFSNFGDRSVLIQSMKLMEITYKDESATSSNRVLKVFEYNYLSAIMSSELQKLSHIRIAANDTLFGVYPAKSLTVGGVSANGSFNVPPQGAVEAKFHFQPHILNRIDNNVLIYGYAIDLLDSSGASITLVCPGTYHIDMHMRNGTGMMFGPVVPKPYKLLPRTNKPVCETVSSPIP